MDDRNDLLRELMAVFDELPAPLRDAINYAAEPLEIGRASCRERV